MSFTTIRIGDASYPRTGKENSSSGDTKLGRRRDIHSRAQHPTQSPHQSTQILSFSLRLGDVGCGQAHFTRCTRGAWQTYCGSCHVDHTVRAALLLIVASTSTRNRVIARCVGRTLATSRYVIHFRLRLCEVLDRIQVSCLLSS